MLIPHRLSPAWTVENAVTQEIFAATITRIAPGQRVALGRPAFGFKWKDEIAAPGRQVFRLTTAQNPGITHGLLSLSPAQGCVEMHLIESAKFNRGPHKQYLRVAGNLITQACRLSYEWGHDGYVFFMAKTGLVDHYQRAYGAKQVRQGQQMAIEPAAARLLLNRYYNGYLTNPR